MPTKRKAASKRELIEPNKGDTLRPAEIGRNLWEDCRHRKVAVGGQSHQGQEKSAGGQATAAIQSGNSRKPRAFLL